MKILAVGGGSGGHVTPVLAVINALAELDPKLQVLFVCDRAFEAQSRVLMKTAPVQVVVRTISAGKLRRYHGVAWYRQLFDLPTVSKNITDIGRIMRGFTQSLGLLRRERPDVVFAKGGYVCLPIGLAAKFLKIPIVIHDSDTRPGLTNRVLARYAAAIATGSPVENYPSYRRAITTYTGVPIDAAFRHLTTEEIREARSEMGFKDLDRPLVVVTGGGLGAESINEAMLYNSQRIIQKGIEVYHVAGRAHYQDVSARAPQDQNYQVVEFVFKDMARILGAADVVVSRGSATFTQELAAIGAVMIMIPAGHLGDQVKNAEVYKQEQAALVLKDDEIKNSPILGDTVLELLEHPEVSQAMARRLASFARPNAARDVAELIKHVVETKR